MPNISTRIRCKMWMWQYRWDLNGWWLTIQESLSAGKFKKGKYNVAVPVRLVRSAAQLHEVPSTATAFDYFCSPTRSETFQWPRRALAPRSPADWMATNLVTAEVPEVISCLWFPYDKHLLGVSMVALDIKVPCADCDAVVSGMTSHVVIAGTFLRHHSILP